MHSLEGAQGEIQGAVDAESVASNVKYVVQMPLWIFPPPLPRLASMRMIHLARQNDLSTCCTRR